MFCGMFLSTIGTSMIWPFLMIYVSEKLSQSLTAVAFLLTINAVMSLVVAFFAGPLTDKFGRKPVLVVSLIGNGLVYFMMGQATSLTHFAILMIFWGMFSPLYRVGGDAMVADLVESQKRPDAYALLRMSNNIGIAIGPAIGGFVATSSYTITFICAATGLICYGLLLQFFAHETLPIEARLTTNIQYIFRGYKQVFQDSLFMRLVFSFALALMTIIPMWVLLSVYVKTEYGIPENQFGLIATTNALLVVIFQLPVTQRTKRFPPIRVMTAATAIYAVAVFSISLASGFWGFWLCMVFMTTGELMLVPTASTFAANLAPIDMRGRYMSIYGLSWGIASGISSPIGGFLSDTFGPQYIWYGAALLGVMGVISFLFLGRAAPNNQVW
jgi:MFS family permease